MKKQKYFIWKKTIALLLSIMFFCALVASIYVIAVMANDNYYSTSQAKLKQQRMHEKLNPLLYDIFAFYAAGEDQYQHRYR